METEASYWIAIVLGSAALLARVCWGDRPLI